ncbi:MAG TPA: Crp/Fnr family transcriptional regulator [Ohtaekwangia sp.]|nr:Crp/Fnr family transcriptional regulator [Ohtaekwangia sp.]
MTSEQLIEVLSSMHPLSEAFKDALQKETARIILPKDYYLLEAPKISGHTYFIEKGFAVAYSFVRGEKQIDRFYGPGQIVVSPKSFFEQHPSREFIQLTTQSEVLYLTHSAAIAIAYRFIEANVIYRTIMNEHYEQCMDRLHDMQHLDAAQRYKKLHDNFPGIEQAVPQEYIASYLGIAPQSLSRLKKKDR